MSIEVIIASVLSFLAMVLSSFAAYKSNTRAKTIEATTMTPGDVRDRLDEVEGRVGKLQNEQWEDREYMRRMVSAMLSAGLKLPWPYPAWMAMHFNQEPHHPETPGSIIAPHQTPPRPGAM